MAINVGAGADPRWSLISGDPYRLLIGGRLVPARDGTVFPPSEPPSPAGDELPGDLHRLVDGLAAVDDGRQAAGDAGRIRVAPDVVADRDAGGAGPDYRVLDGLGK